MPEEPTAPTGEMGEPKPKRGIRERVHEHLVAAGVAAEEAAGYGWATEAVEATEAAVSPEHELGKNEEEEEKEEKPGDASR